MHKGIVDAFKSLAFNESLYCDDCTIGNASNLSLFFPNQNSKLIHYLDVFF